MQSSEELTSDWTSSLKCRVKTLQVESLEFDFSGDVHQPSEAMVGMDLKTDCVKCMRELLARVSEFLWALFSRFVGLRAFGDVFQVKTVKFCQSEPRLPQTMVETETAASSQSEPSESFPPRFPTLASPGYDTCFSCVEPSKATSALPWSEKRHDNMVCWKTHLNLCSPWPLQLILTPKPWSMCTFESWCLAWVESVLACRCSKHKPSNWKARQLVLPS